MEGLAITVDEMLGSTGLAMKVDPGVPVVYAGFAGKALTHQSHACQLLLAHSRPSPHLRMRIVSCERRTDDANGLSFSVYQRATQLMASKYVDVGLYRIMSQLHLMHRAVIVALLCRAFFEAFIHSMFCIVYVQCIVCFCSVQASMRRVCVL